MKEPLRNVKQALYYRLLESRLFTQIRYHLYEVTVLKCMSSICPKTVITAASWLYCKMAFTVIVGDFNFPLQSPPLAKLQELEIVMVSQSCL